MSPDPRMEELLHALDGIVWEADPAAAGLRFVSRQAERLLGYPLARWLEEPTFWEDHLHPEDRDWATARRAEAAREQRGQVSEYRMVAQDGRTVWLQDRVTVAEGRPAALQGLMVDITRQKEREATAAAIQQRWHQHVDQTLLAVIEWDREGLVLSWNPAAEKIFGYDAREALGQPILDLVLQADPDLQDRARRLAAALLNGETQPEFQHVNVRKDGTPIICRWFNTPLTDGRGRPIGVASMALEVTDLAQATLALAESEGRFRKLVELNPNAIVIQAQGQWRYANAMALQLFGVPSLEALQTRPVLEWVQPEHRAQVADRMRRVLTGTPQPEEEIPFLRQDGTGFPAMVHGIAFTHQSEPAILGVLRDITQQKADAAAVERARDSYRSLLMELPLLVWKGTPEGGCEYVNQAWVAFTGRPLAQLQGHQWADCVHPEDQPALMATYGAALASRQPMAMEFRMRHQGGDYRWVQGHGKPFFDLNGRFDGFLAACNDIHDSRTAEALLAAQEQRFRTVADFTYDWEYWTDQEGRLLWMSPSCARVTGYSAKAFTADPALLVGLVHPEDRALHDAHLQAAQSGLELHSLDFRIRHRDGRWLWINHICTPVFDAHGHSMGRRISNRDITSRRQVEADLLEASQQRLAMLEAASVARVVPWSRPPEGPLRWGDSASQVFGWSAEELAGLGDWPWDLLLAEDRPRLLHALREVEAGLVASAECRMRHRNGSVLWTRWTAALHQGVLRGAVQDVSEQHGVQEQLLQSQKLESLGELVGGVTHDFNNLLAAILGYCELFEAEPNFTPRQRRGLDAIQKAAGRGRDLVEQLLGFSRKAEVVRRAADLDATVAEACDLLARAIPQAIVLEQRLHGHLPQALLDPGRVHQVVMNLVINARDALPQGGRVTVSTALEAVDASLALSHQRPPGTYAVLRVEDNGCGIPAEGLQRILEPFYSTKGARGTGLGLSVVNSIVADHGGFLTCHSEVGQGTRFSIYLPLAAPAPA